MGPPRARSCGESGHVLTGRLDILSAAPVASPLVGSLPRPKQTAAPSGARQRSAGSQRRWRAPVFNAIAGSLQPGSPHEASSRGSLLNHRSALARPKRIIRRSFPSVFFLLPLFPKVQPLKKGGKFLPGYLVIRPSSFFLPSDRGPRFAPRAAGTNGRCAGRLPANRLDVASLRRAGG